MSQCKTCWTLQYIVKTIRTELYFLPRNKFETGGLFLSLQQSVRCGGFSRREEIDVEAGVLVKTERGEGKDNCRFNDSASASDLCSRSTCGGAFSLLPGRFCNPAAQVICFFFFTCRSRGRQRAPWHVRAGASKTRRRPRPGTIQPN